MAATRGSLERFNRPDIENGAGARWAPAPHLVPETQISGCRFPPPEGKGRNRRNRVSVDERMDQGTNPIHPDSDPAVEYDDSGDILLSRTVRSGLTCWFDHGCMPLWERTTDQPGAGQVWSTLYRADICRSSHETCHHVPTPQTIYQQALMLECGGG